MEIAIVLILALLVFGPKRLAGAIARQFPTVHCEFVPLPSAL